MATDRTRTRSSSRTTTRPETASTRETLRSDTTSSPDATRVQPASTRQSDPEDGYTHGRPAGRFGGVPIRRRG